MKLSILILTIPAREHLLAALVHGLRPQIAGKPVEVLINRNPTQNIGKKRNTLLGQAKGDYIVFIDDDDAVSRSYVDKILAALETCPDCVGISGAITTNGKNSKNWHISMDYTSWFEDSKVFYRSPNHISPVKRDIALQAMFPETSYGEDAEYSRRILPLLKTEVKIKGLMYTYRYNSKK